MRIKTGTILLLADGSRMLLLRNQGDTARLELEVMEHRTCANPPNREMLSDAPGVGHGTSYPGRTTFDKADPHQDNEDRFVASAALALEEMAADRDGELVVIAPPDTLGVLRLHYGPTVKARLIAEIDKDLTKHPVGEIERLLDRYEIPAQSA